MLIFACKLEGHCEKFKDLKFKLSLGNPLTSPTGQGLVWPVIFVSSGKERCLFAQIGWCMLENDFSFRAVPTMTVFSENLHTGNCTASNALYEQWGNTNCFLFQVRPGAGKEVSSGLFALPEGKSHPGVSSFVLESWVPVPRTFSCLCFVWWQSPGKKNWLHLKRINWKQQYVKS